MSDQEGGPAFPVDANTGDLESWRMGMSLRDYFAGQFMCGFIERWRYEDPSDDERFDVIAKTLAVDVYRLADAMLKARSL